MGKRPQEGRRHAGIHRFGRKPPDESQLSNASIFPDRGDAQRLWNLAARIPDANRYSRIYRDRPDLIDHIDHILASHTITTQVSDGDIKFHGPRPDSVTDNPNTDGDRPGSDHRPLLLTIDL